MSAIASAAVPAARPVAGRRALVLTPPEGVPLTLTIASLGARVGAQLIDLVATLAATAALALALGASGAVRGEALTAVVSLITLILGTPAYMLSELLMNGRTPGKRLVGIRVVSPGGAGLSVHQIVVRNLLKEVELFLPLQILPFLALGQTGAALLVVAWAIVIFAVPARSPSRQRIGDLAAGTVVVEQPVARLLPDLAAGAGQDAAGRFAFTSGQLDLYGAYELQVLERLLRQRDGPGAPEAALGEVSASIRRKIGYAEPVAAAEDGAFLLAFYRAQRAFLERKRLFGEARGDKFHRQERRRTSSED